MISIIPKIEGVSTEVYCYTCDAYVTEFILLTPPQWIDPNHNEYIHICFDCAQKIADKIKKDK